MRKQRVRKKELIDFGLDAYSKEEYFDCLAKLDRVGRLLGGYRASFKAFDRLDSTPSSILDVGCGGGYFAIALAKRYPQAAVVGIDINPLAIEHANKVLLSMKYPPKNVSFELRHIPQLSEAENSYDVVTSMLVCHHLDDHEIIDFINRAGKVAKKSVIFNDLQRSRLAYNLFKGIAPFLFRNRLVQHDGPLSVARSFIKSDWQRYLTASNIPKTNSKITWHWAFRYCITISKDD